MATVVIVDDSPAWRAAARLAVTTAGHTVVGEASDGLEALEVIRAQHPDLVTLDIQMPAMNGLECLEHLRMLDPHVVVVMVTGVSGPTTRQRARDLGANGFVAKPYEPEDLILAITEALA